MPTCCGGKGIGKPISPLRYVMGRVCALCIYSGYFFILVLLSLFDKSYRQLMRFYFIYTKDELKSIKVREDIAITTNNTVQ